MVLVALSVIAPSLAGASEPCRSERRGFCVRLTSEDAKQARRERMGTLATAIEDLPFPGLEFMSGPPFNITYGKNIGDILIALYRFGVVIVALGAFGNIVIGGFLYMTSDALGTMSTARKMITNSIVALIIVLLSYLLLYIINPDFTFTLKLRPLKY